LICASVVKNLAFRRLAARISSHAQGKKKARPKPCRPPTQDVTAL
jgi:hypothetical protein